MSASGRSSARLPWVIGSVALGAGVIAGVFYFTRNVSQIAAPATAPVAATRPASFRPAATQAAATRPSGPQTFIDVVKLTYPDCPATQPLPTPLDRKNAAHLLLRDPVYLDRSGNVWITRADAEPTMPTLAKTAKETEHVVRERPAYVHWRFEPGMRRGEPGHSTPVLICPAEGDETIAFIDEKKRVEIAPKSGGYHWAEAFSWNDNVVVANTGGASIFARTETGWEETVSPALVESGTPRAPTRIPVTATGLLAYIPAEAGKPGGKVARFENGTWKTLDDNGKWPANILHLIPLVDGSVLQILVDPKGEARVAIVELDVVKVDEKPVLQLIRQLDDDSPEQRAAAFARLSTYGTGLWPILEREMPLQPAGVREKMAELLKNKTDPTLGEMTLIDTTLKLVARTPDGGALFYSKGGVSVTNVDGDQTLNAPAWIAARAGQPIRLQLGTAWNDLTPRNTHFYAMGGDDWIVSDDVLGPREFIGTFDLQPILRKNEVQYSEFIGVDRRGRWFFREPPADGKPAEGKLPGLTLVLDPTLPPISPRLPVWEFTAVGNAVGCDEHDWPAYRDKAGNVWIIGENGFELQAKDKGGRFIFDPAELAARSVARAEVLIPTTGPSSAPTAASQNVPATQEAIGPASRASTGPSTVASSLQTMVPNGPPLAVTRDGTRYFGGKASLRVIYANGREVDWPLPGKAQGEGTGKGTGEGNGEAKGERDVSLVIDKDGRLFLFNSPGRVVRISPTPGSAEPFKHDATFSHKIPDSDAISRIWLDPANRIIIAHDERKLAICFPSGVIPQSIAELMPAAEQDDDFESREEEP